MEEMDYVVKWENLFVELIKDEVVWGCMIIFVNINYINLELMAIGIVFKCKVNVNIGVFFNFFNIDEEVEKLFLFVKYGVDMVMDLFIGGGDLDVICIVIINVFFVFIGIVFIY